MTTTLTPADAPAPAAPAAPSRGLSWTQVRTALPGAARGLDPRKLWRQPVLLIVEAGAALTTVLAIAQPSVFGWLVALWLWATAFFAALAEAIAEARGKAQAASLRATQQHTVAHLLAADADLDAPASWTAVEVPSSELTVGALVVVEAGQVIPGDGDVVAGIASVDESAITGESAPVIRESGGDRCAVTGGTVVLSDRIVVRVTARPGDGFVDRMIALVEGSERRRTPNEIALGLLLSSLTVVFLLAVATLQAFAVFSGARQDIVVLVALLVCLIPTTIGALLSAIGIAGMDRLVQRNVLATSGRAVEAAGDVDVLLLDKTGTITFGNRRASDLIPAPGVALTDLANAARLASLADDTPEGRSIVELVDARPDADASPLPASATLVEFSAHTRMSGIDLPAGGHAERAIVLRKGAASAVQAWIDATRGDAGGDPAAGAATASAGDKAVADAVAAVSREGGTPLVIARQVGDGVATALGVIHLKDVVKPGMRERFDRLRAMGIRTVMVTGDNAITARAIAAEAGVDDVLAEATPEDKLALIRREQEGGRLVAMAGDGTNDAPALAQADVGVAMASGTSAAKEAGNMVDLDSDPTKLIEIVEIGKQLLITRGALTTFSVSNDVAKYFAILPAMFAPLIPGLDALNIMGLTSPQTAIASAVIFNALIIVALVPLALRGVKYRPSSASALLARNLWIYGVGGLIAPFLGIKAIDMILTVLGL
ncbi:potassium-transporting ATPase subunit KdpB [Demequina sp. NBRC 110057]|uniref:potassium-transporting ATPase subunit KdpB n=1 Tax=Demequina sp. NBRC 110057 TaxID=1570346 RepID=UPI000A030734|nr:potassium-transporting ATPase subunit KdpB [Demequina sp. NBRC 110057]